MAYTSAAHHQHQQQYHHHYPPPQQPQHSQQQPPAASASSSLWDNGSGSDSIRRRQEQYLNSVNHTSAIATSVEAGGFEKDFLLATAMMEEASTTTAPTHATGQSHQQDDDDDDTTTIRSLDGLLSLTEEDDAEAVHDKSTAAGPPSPTITATPRHAAAATTTASVRGVGAGSTCSISTVATDEASSVGDWASYDTATRIMKQQQQQFSSSSSSHQQQQHRRVPSWEVSPHSQFSQQQQQPAGRGSPAVVHLPPASLSPHQAWSSQQHVASFRGDQPQYPPRGWNQQTPPRYGSAVVDPSLPFLPGTNGSARATGGSIDRNVRPNSNTYAYHAQQQQHPTQQQQQQQLLQRKPYSSQPPLIPPSSTSNVTPPRVSGSGSAERGRGGHHRVLSGSSPHRSQQQQLQQQQQSPTAGSSARSSSEVLKTLLRKKACLYEPDTSRAVSLVTWLVGRVLALQYGFFSRQQLQAGVHACVADKIDSGAITRTKVNRCMQIILNSCFHYIIPRPDGTEENGDVFRAVFATEMKDDRFLLSVLPAPWNNIAVERDAVLNASLDDLEVIRNPVPSHPQKSPYATPASSPRLGPLSEQRSPGGKESLDGDSSDAKRAVLLCFNENVRSAEDVFRCHNEFIRDTAHASHLQLSSSEWRTFFGKEAASAPHLWGNVGIPVPYLEGQGPSQTDALGMFTVEETGCLRTSWCCKRYEHDHELCGFAHAEVNGGWLRRNPNVRYYKDEICRFVTSLPIDSRDGPIKLSINECPHGVKCEYAHSMEESVYHPRRYKHQGCPSVGRAGGCAMADMCPKFHPADSYRFPKKSDGRSSRHARQAYPHSSKGSAQTPSNIPPGSPILYASPAPTSSYEEHLLMPGLQSLFRRNCAITRSTQRSGMNAVGQYDLFGDDAGVPQSSDKKYANPHSETTIRPPQQLRR